MHDEDDQSLIVIGYILLQNIGVSVGKIEGAI